MTVGSNRPLLRVQLLPDAIVNKRFRTTWRGYDREEVRQFLKELAETYSAALAAAANEADILRMRLAEAERRAITRATNGL